MLFNSLQFLLFFPVVTVMYFLLPHRFRWMHLLAASCLFYMAFIPVYVLILLFTILVDYAAGLLIARAEGARRKWYLVMSIVANVGVLAVFKYCNFFVANVNAALHSLYTGAAIPLLHIILPIGLSFHTFQAMSYTIEVYRGHQPAERHLGIYALYVMFYPQLVAGPIERPQHLLHQFREVHHFDYDRVTSGLKLMLWGMFKKVVIADRLAVFVNRVYGTPADFQGLPLWVATGAFALQIFCDFSGYSDIAIGSARVMGFSLMKNFDRPYSAKSISEFWRRWHISLSTWFRDYLYISLGGNRVPQARWLLNLMVVFLVSGFWHGANWTFVVWGALHGSYLIAGTLTQPWRARLAALTRLDRVPVVRRVFQVLLTFSLVTFAWIFFRAQSLGDAWYILSHLFKPSLAQIDGSWVHGLATLRLGITKYHLPLLGLALVIMEGVHWIQSRRNPVTVLGRLPIWVRWPAYYALVLIILAGGVSATQFIYFQF